MSLYPPLKSHWIALSAAFVAAGAMLLGGHAAAQSSVDAPPNFPQSLDRDVLIAWLKRETDIPPDSVVAITPSALTSLMSTRVMVSPPGYSVALRAESLSPEVYAREGSLSWNTAIDVDCGKRRIRQGPTTGYVSRNLLYTGKPVRPADRDWISPPPGSTLENVWRAVCDKKFERPLATTVSAGVKPPVVAAELAPPFSAPPPSAPARPAKAATPSYPPIGASPTPATKIYPPAPAPAPPTAAPPAPPAPPTLRPAVTPRPATPKPAPPPPAPPPAAVEGVEPARSTSTSPAAAQLSASSTPAEAEQSLAAVAGRYAEQLVGRTTHVARAVVKGKVYYRALVEGFSSTADAQGFCRSLNVTGQACFVRPNGVRD